MFASLDEGSPRSGLVGSTYGEGTPSVLAQYSPENYGLTPKMPASQNPATQQDGGAITGDAPPKTDEPQTPRDPRGARPGAAEQQVGEGAADQELLGLAPDTSRQPDALPTLAPAPSATPLDGGGGFGDGDFQDFAPTGSGRKQPYIGGFAPQYNIL